MGISRARRRLLGSGAAWFTEGKANGIDPTFWADFINNRYAVNGVEYAYSDVFTHTRSTTGTRFNSAGQLVTEAINAPRFNFDPATLTPRGLLMEEQRTNLCLNSEDMTQASWVGVAATITADQATAPNGTTTMDLLSETATSNFHFYRALVSITAGATLTVSCFVKKHSRDFVYIGLTDGSVTKFGRTIFSFTTGLFTGDTSATYTIVDKKAEDCGGGVWRISLTVATSVDTGVRYNLGTALDATTNVFLGDTAQGVYAWGHQIEVGAFPTSYIQTTSATATRSGDSVLNSSANVVPFASWYNATEGCYNPTFNYIGMTAASFPQMMMAIDAGATNRIGVLVDDSGTPTANFQSFVAGAYQGIVTSALNPTGITTKVAGAYKNNDGAVSLNGLGAVADAAFGIPTVVDRLNILASTSPACVHMMEARYYNQRITNSELVRLTA